jgi:hypothetical protein
VQRLVDERGVMLQPALRRGQPQLRLAERGQRTRPLQDVSSLSASTELSQRLERRFLAPASDLGSHIVGEHATGLGNRCVDLEW